MDPLQRFAAYAADFEKTYDDDDWSRLEGYFAEERARIGSIDPRILEPSGLDRMLGDVEHLLDETGSIMLTAYANLLSAVLALLAIVRLFARDQASGLYRDLLSGLQDVSSARPGLLLWQIAQLARHPQRPYAADYIDRIFTDFEELHGDRTYADDHAVVGGLARLEGQPLLIIGHQKGRDTKSKVRHNFGMPRPEGYRKALRLMRMAERVVVTRRSIPIAMPRNTNSSQMAGDTAMRRMRWRYEAPSNIFIDSASCASGAGRNLACSSDRPQVTGNIAPAPSRSPATTPDTGGRRRDMIWGIDPPFHARRNTTRADNGRTTHRLRAAPFMSILDCSV